MKTLSLQAKKAYFALVRQSNYAASLRLEGFSAMRLDAKRAVSAPGVRHQPAPTTRKV